MQTIGIVSPGAMGSAVGSAYAAAGHRVVTTVAGRSERTASLVAQAGLELLPDLDAVIAQSALVLSIVPPDQATATAAALATAADRTGARPLVSDWNAVSPATALELERILSAAGSSSSTAPSPAGHRAPITGHGSTSRGRVPKLSLPLPLHGSTHGSSVTRSASHRR